MEALRNACPGVSVVRDGEFAGVAAPTPAAAAEALSALTAQWKSEPQTSAKTLFTDLKQGEPGSNNERGSNNQRGSVEPALARAYKKHASTYTIAYIAHAPLEPRAAVAEWNGDKLTVWTGTQRPFGVRGELAQAFHIPEDNVRVIMPDTGSGYGGKHTGDAAIEAARLAKAAGKPVKIVWTREEEFTWAYFRPGGRDRGAQRRRHQTARITAWEFHNYNSGTSGIGTPVRYRQHENRVSPDEIAAAPGLLSRPGRAPRTISRANRTWMNWPHSPEWNRSNFACAI